MSRIYGSDILAKVVSIMEEGRLFNDVVKNYSDILDEVALERGFELEHLLSVSIDYMKNQYPEACIRLGDSEMIDEELSLDIDNTGEVYPVDVMVMLIDIEEIYSKQECYIEALQKLFYGYTDDDITYIICERTIRGRAYNEQEQIFKVMGVSLKIRIQ